MKIQPLADMLTLRVRKPEERVSGGGVVIPAATTSQTRVDRGTVLDVGPDCVRGLEVGDEVIFNQYAGSVVQMDDDEVLLLTEADITAKLYDVVPVEAYEGLRDRATVLANEEAHVSEMEEAIADSAG